MRYNATEEELCMIEDSKITKSADSAYISCIINGSYRYLTIHGEIKKGEELKDEAYHDSVDIAEAFLTEWTKNKELQEEIKDTPIIKKMNLTEFQLTIKDFK